MRTLTTRLLILALIVAMASPLAACGRKGALDRPGDGDYPGSYPAELKKEKE